MTAQQEIEFEEMRKEFADQGLIYAPNSIYHGMKLHDPKRQPLRKSIMLDIQLERLNDFLDYLFVHSEHCNHITQSEAHEEFIRWEYEQILNHTHSPLPNKNTTNTKH